MTNFLVTAYCACWVCCGPHANGITASGRAPVEGRTVAMNGVPFGTRVYLQGLGWRVVEDRMAPRYKGPRVDVYFRSHRQAVLFGVRRLPGRSQPPPTTSPAGGLE